jgi:hypothetical protein
MDEPTLGLMPSYWNAIFCPEAPWFRPNVKSDPRNFPNRTGGRRMRHPYLPPIVYPRPPDQTTNFGFDPLSRIPSATVKTLGGSAVAKFPEFFDDIRITETWFADGLSTTLDLFHHFYSYWKYQLPAGFYIGWQPRDLTPKNFFIDILDVRLGTPEEFNAEELGNYRPFMTRQALSIMFKLVREVKSPSGVVVSIGN